LLTALATGALALCLAAIHLFIGRLRLLEVVPRSRGLSFAGGVAVAYVFLHILPELAGRRRAVAEGLETGGSAAEAIVHLVALAGLSSFYGLERAIKTARGGAAGVVAARLFWLHGLSFALYNVLIGYLLPRREEAGLWPLALYFVAMALHFATTDYGLRKDHAERYDAVVRWIMAGGLLIGWGIGLATALPEVAVGLLFAFLAGGIVLNVLKEELPEERRSRFWPFALGAGGYAALLAVA
jgi:hypothetical protein